jgi:hypothetical protein
VSFCSLGISPHPFVNLYIRSLLRLANTLCSTTPSLLVALSSHVSVPFPLPIPDFAWCRRSGRGNPSFYSSDGLPKPFLLAEVNKCILILRLLGSQLLGCHVGGPEKQQLKQKTHLGQECLVRPIYPRYVTSN